MKVTHKLLIVNFMKLYPAISVPVSLTVKWPKNITEINRGCQLHSRNQSNEKISYMLIVKNVGILFYNATIRNIGTNWINRLKQPKGNTTMTFWLNISQTSKSHGRLSNLWSINGNIRCHVQNSNQMALLLMMGLTLPIISINSLLMLVIHWLSPSLRHITIQMTIYLIMPVTHFLLSR